MATHQCRIIHEPKGSKSVRIDEFSGGLRFTSGVLDHVGSLGRIKLSFRHLARDNFAHMRRQVCSMIFVADIDDRVAKIPNGWVSYTNVRNSKADPVRIVLFFVQ